MKQLDKVHFAFGWHGQALLVGELRHGPHGQTSLPMPPGASGRIMSPLLEDEKTIGLNWSK
jgi:hypothetical protein